jgi:hypothetical protein
MKVRKFKRARDRVTLSPVWGRKWPEPRPLVWIPALVRPYEYVFGAAEMLVKYLVTHFMIGGIEELSYLATRIGRLDARRGPSPAPALTSKSMYSGVLRSSHVRTASCESSRRPSAR